MYENVVNDVVVAGFEGVATVGVSGFVFAVVTDIVVVERTRGGVGGFCLAVVFVVVGCSLVVVVVVVGRLVVVVVVVVAVDVDIVVVVEVEVVVVVVYKSANCKPNSHIHNTEQQQQRRQQQRNKISKYQIQFTVASYNRTNSNVKSVLMQ